MRSHDPDEMTTTPLESFPPMEKWDDWIEYDAKAWPRKVEKHYMLVPTTCFNCEAACGLVAYVDKADLSIRKLEGNPHHPGSRGRNCAKGPATLNQVEDPERILYPLKRVGSRGSGKFERTSWDHVLDTLAAQIHLGKNYCYFYNIAVCGGSNVRRGSCNFVSGCDALARVSRGAASESQR